MSYGGWQQAIRVMCFVVSDRTLGCRHHCLWSLVKVLLKYVLQLFIPLTVLIISNTNEL